jgi:predicted component of type VI protein secretion system
VKLHPFLKHIDWADLSVKKAKSPLKINLTTETDTAYFSSEFTRMPLSDEAPSRPRKASPAAAPASSANVDKQFVDWDHAAPTSDLL